MRNTEGSAYERIIAAAAKLFASQGFDGTTTRQIVAEAGSSLSAIQNHFQSKEALYRAVLERASEKFYAVNSSILEEIEREDRQGILRGEVAWDRTAELIGQLVEWAFNEDYFYEIKVINIEYLRMGKNGELLDSVLGLYDTFEMLFSRYAGREKEPWMSMLSFTVVSTAFDCANYRNVLGKVTKRDLDLPENCNEVKAFLKNYLLSSLRANLEMYKK